MEEELSTGIERSPAARVMDEAIELAIQGNSPYPERATFVDADSPEIGQEISLAAKEGMAVVVVNADCTTTILRPDSAEA
jgi:hypothetical protein